MSTTSKKTPAAPKAIAKQKVEHSIGSVADAFEVLNSLATQEIAGDIAGRILRIVKANRETYARYIEARRVEAEKFGEKVGEVIQVPQAKVTEFNEVMAPIRAELVELDPDLRLDAKMLAGVKITARALETLAPFVADA